MHFVDFVLCCCLPWHINYSWTFIIFVWIVTRSTILQQLVLFSYWLQMLDFSSLLYFHSTKKFIHLKSSWFFVLSHYPATWLTLKCILIYISTQPPSTSLEIEACEILLKKRDASSLGLVIQGGIDTPLAEFGTLIRDVKKGRLYHPWIHTLFLEKKKKNSIVFDVFYLAFVCVCVCVCDNLRFVMRSSWSKFHTKSFQFCQFHHSYCVKICVAQTVGIYRNTRYLLWISVLIPQQRIICFHSDAWVANIQPGQVLFAIEDIPTATLKHEEICARLRALWRCTDLPGFHLVGCTVTLKELIYWWFSFVFVLSDTFLYLAFNFWFYIFYPTRITCSFMLLIFRRFRKIPSTPLIHGTLHACHLDLMTILYVYYERLLELESLARFCSPSFSICSISTHILINALLYAAACWYFLHI